MSKRLRLLRRVSQALFFAGFLLLFAVAAYPLLSPVPVDLFLRADPLLALSAMISLRQLVFPALWYALIVVAFTILLGRVFCGWICPTGTTIDIFERLFRIRGRRPSAGPRLSSLKFYILIAILITAALPAAHRDAAKPSISGSVGLSAVYLFDPIALLTRTLTLTGLPATHWAIGMGGDILNGWNSSDAVQDHPWIAVLLSPFQMAYGLVGRPEGAYFRLGVITFLVFAGIIALSRYARRFWCRNLCPLGALLGWLGRLSPIRLRVSEKCTRCMRCVNECKMGAISDDPHTYSGAECIECYSCIAVCPENAISLARGYGGEEREDDLRLDRRRVLAAMGAGVAAVALPKAALGVRRSDAGEHVLKISSLRLLRPPGALAEDAFVTACVRCGECMKVCLTNTLQPALGEGGLEALGTPIIVPRVNACAQPCDLCGRVCPSNAIQPFTVEEKSHLFLGTASVDRSMCIAWSADRACMVCDEACPYNAIDASVSAEGVARPVVDERICVGCGMCEYVCPVEPRGAIRVGSSGDKRHLTRNEQRAIRELAEEETLEQGSPYPGL